MIQDVCLKLTLFVVKTILNFGEFKKMINIQKYYAVTHLLTFAREGFVGLRWIVSYLTISQKLD